MPHLKNIDFTNEAEVTAYVQEVTRKEDPLRHENYDITIAQAHDMSVHIKGILPVDLIQTYRPHEQGDAYDYRITTYEPVTKADSKKVINALSRIQNSSFTINWPEPSGKVGKETLEKYVTEDYPFFGSVSNWIFKTILKQDLADPNSVVAFKPLDEQLPQNEFFSPFGFWYGSAKVWDFKIDTYYTLLTDEKSHVTEGNQGIEVPKGIVLNIYTLNEVIRVWQVGKLEDNDFTWMVIHQHDFNKTPVFRLKGEYVEDTMPFLYESFMAGVLPYWNKVIRQESDKDASFVSDIFPERVEMEIECDKCNGKQVVESIRKGKEISIKCDECHGTGYHLARSPLTKTVVRRKSKLDPEADITFPGVEYLTKETDTTKLLKEEINDNRRLGFASINMEFLSNIPLNQSGKAKEVDRTEPNAYIEMVSKNLFEIKRNSIENINLWRYFIVLSEQELEDQLPEIREPTNFDIMTAQMITQEINAAKDANLSQDVIASLESDFINKRFVNSPEQTDFFTSLRELDPIPGTTLEEKLFALNAKSVTKLDVVLSTNLATFIKQLISQDQFFKLTREQRLVELNKLAKAKINTINQTNGLRQEIPPETE